MHRPRIILLNGVSSSGKTTLAKGLQARLPDPYLHVGIDTFEEMMPPQHHGPEVFARMLSGFHRSLRALAEAGNDLIIDHVLVEDEPPRDWVPECLGGLVDFPTFFVGVRCPLEELARREAVRGDRPSGLSAWQFSRMHRRTVYDLEIDTATSAPEECVGQAMAALRFPGLGVSRTLALHAP